MKCIKLFSIAKGYSMCGRVSYGRKTQLSEQPIAKITIGFDPAPHILISEFKIWMPIFLQFHHKIRNASENVVQSNKMVTVHYHSGLSFQWCQPEPMLSSFQIHLCWILPSIQNKLVNGWKPNIKPPHCNLCSIPFPMPDPPAAPIHSVFPFRKSFHIEFTKEWGVSEQLVQIEITQKFSIPPAAKAHIISKSCLLFWKMQMVSPANYTSDSMAHVPRISTNNPITIAKCRWWRITTRGL